MLTHAAEYCLTISATVGHKSLVTNAVILRKNGLKPLRAYVRFESENRAGGLLDDPERPPPG